MTENANVAAQPQGEDLPKGKFNTVALALAVGSPLLYMILATVVEFVARMVMPAELFSNIITRVALNGLIFVSLALTVYVSLNRSDDTFRSFFRLEKWRWSYLGWGALGAVAAYVTSATLGGIIYGVMGSGSGEGAPGVSGSIAELPVVQLLFISFVFISFLTPIAEELFFRGAVLGAWRRIAPSGGWASKLATVAGVLFSTLFFASMHYVGPLDNASNLVSVVGPGIVGLFGALLSLKLKSLYPAIILHMLYNFCVVAIILTIRFTS